MRLATWAALFAAALGISPPVAAAAAGDQADTVFLNGAVFTMEAGRPRAEAVAVKGKRIVHVGSTAGAKALVGPRTRVVDLAGRMLLPGFVDAHQHTTAAHVTVGADLQHDRSEEIVAAARAWADRNAGAPLVVGFGWRFTAFPLTGPRKEVLDAAFPDRPALLVAIDGHSAWLNSKALAMAGIDARTPDPLPPTSYFARDEKGEPTGWLVEVPAMQVAFAKLKPPSLEAIAAAMRTHVQALAAAGITAVFDAGVLGIPTEAGYGILRGLEKQGALPVRVVGSFYWNDPSVKDPVAAVRRLHGQFDSELVKASVLKVNVDGGDFQHTAVMLRPYADRPGFHGDFVLDPKVIAAAVRRAQAAGMDTHAHVFGDGAMVAYLDAVEAARKAHPRSRSRHTAAHALYLTDALIARIVRLDVTVQHTPHWSTPDPSLRISVDQTIGKEVFDEEYGRSGSVLRKGGRVAFGSDWPASGYVSSFLPLDEIQASMTRSILTRYGTAKFADVLPPPGERITLDEALRAQTIAAAWVLHAEDRLGSIRVGKQADLVVLEKDLHDVPPGEINQVRVQLTMMGGKVTWRDGL